MGPLSNLARFFFVVVTPLVLVAGALVTLFAIGALFDALEHQDELRSRIQGLFRRPVVDPKAPGKDHYYRPYWAR
jgi:hypothetical protein